jgi:hypothetical protein
MPRHGNLCTFTEIRSLATTPELGHLRRRHAFVCHIKQPPQPTPAIHPTKQPNPCTTITDQDLAITTPNDRSQQPPYLATTPARNLLTANSCCLLHLCNLQSRPVCDASLMFTKLTFGAGLVVHRVTDHCYAPIPCDPCIFRDVMCDLDDMLTLRMNLSVWKGLILCELLMGCWVE